MVNFRSSNKTTSTSDDLDFVPTALCALAGVVLGGIIATCMGIV